MNAAIKVHREKATILSRHSYLKLVQLLRRKAPIPCEKRTVETQQLYRKISLYKLTLSTVYDPFRERKMHRIIREGKRVLAVEEVGNCIKYHYIRSKGDGARKLHYKMGSIYHGIGTETIQRWLNRQTDCARKRPLFTNKAPLRPVTSKGSNFRHQIDLVDMSACPDTVNGETFKYILSVLDVFSRHLWLRALTNRSAEAVVCAVGKIYNEWKSPAIVQTDQGSEFKGLFKNFCNENNIKLIHSRSHHPQSQGNDERSHATWKAKNRFDMQQGNVVHWSENHNAYHSSIRMTPNDCYFGATSKIRRQAQFSSNEAAQPMIIRSLSKNPPSFYSMGEKVLVRIPRKTTSGVIRGGSSLKKSKCSEGTVIKINAEKHQYKIRLSTDTPNARPVVKWFYVNDITSLTRQKERERNKGRPTSNISQEGASLTYNKVARPVISTNNFTVTFTEAMKFNPAGDGNCQFAAVANDLAYFGIHRSARTLRDDVMLFLRSNSSFYKDNFVSQNWSRYLRKMQRDSTHGDHITLHAMSKVFYVDILVLSSQGTQYTTLVSPDGLFDDQSDLDQLSDVEHSDFSNSDDMPVYEKHNQSILEKSYPVQLDLGQSEQDDDQLQHTYNLRKRPMKKIFSNSWIFPKIRNTLQLDCSFPKHDSDTDEEVSIQRRCGVSYVDISSTCLPLLCLEKIILLCLKTELSSRWRLRAVSKFFKNTVDQQPKHMMYFNQLVCHQLSLNYGVQSSIPICLSANRFVRTARGSSVVMELRSVFHHAK